MTYHNDNDKSGVICDRTASARVKGKVYKVTVRPAMLYGLETVSSYLTSDDLPQIHHVKR